MDLAEGQEAVAVAAILDERRLQRGLDPGHLGEVDVALDLPLGRALEIEVDEVAVHRARPPGSLRVGRIDQHALGHRAESPVARSATSLPSDAGGRDCCIRRHLRASSRCPCTRLRRARASGAVGKPPGDHTRLGARDHAPGVLRQGRRWQNSTRRQHRRQTRLGSPAPSIFAVIGSSRQRHTASGCGPQCDNPRAAVA